MTDHDAVEWVITMAWRTHHRAELGPSSPLSQLAERSSGIIELWRDVPDDLPPADRTWLQDSGVHLIVPLVGSDHHLLGLLMLGEKKSEEPYSAEDLRLLKAIARQITVGRENLRLKEGSIAIAGFATTCWRASRPPRST